LSNQSAFGQIELPIALLLIAVKLSNGPHCLFSYQIDESKLRILNALTITVFQLPN
jgi:hypothetical protein